MEAKKDPTINLNPPINSLIHNNKIRIAITTWRKLNNKMKTIIIKLCLNSLLAAEIIVRFKILLKIIIIKNPK